MEGDEKRKYALEKTQQSHCESPIENTVGLISTLTSLKAVI